MKYYIVLVSPQYFEIEVSKKTFNSFRIGDYMRLHGIGKTRPLCPYTSEKVEINRDEIKYEWWAKSRTLITGNKWIYFTNNKAERY